MTKPLHSLRSNPRSRQRIVVRGAVQGVGFRPFVFREATASGLTGWVGNSTEGVTIEVEGDRRRIADLVRFIRQPPLANAHVTLVTIRDVTLRGSTDFAIRTSMETGVQCTQILPDIATCDACLAELFDPANRRYRYPFINCTQCGPRYSIIEATPYDRARTSMRHFSMCPACRAEYDTPADRRFNAEPNACADCGPRLAMWDAAGVVRAHGDGALVAAAAAVRSGKIVAVKGIGGFHLFADARDEPVMSRLRARKRREAKPFAVMFPTLGAVGDCCAVSGEEASLLAGTARPIVLLQRTGGSIAQSVAPDTQRLGVLLPYAPLHHLLMSELDFPVVATSGNVAGEPIVKDETEALERLRGIADLFLVHNRPIVRAVDDSVAQIVCGAPQLLRRARGYAPAPLPLENAAAGIVAFGAHLKATVAVTCETGIVVSQHLGDQETVAAQDAYRRAHDDIARLHKVRPRVAVCDDHPDYAPTHAAVASGLQVIPVQHHVAHVAACLAENGRRPPALGVAWDGTGYGPDGTIWGGEFLSVTDTAWRRVAHLRPFRLPGGEAAVREPRRSALGLLYAAFGAEALTMSEFAAVAAFGPAERDVLARMLDRGVNAPLTSSMGRLFDAFASLCGCSQRSSYEGQAAAEFESLATGHLIDRQYEIALLEVTDAGGSLVLDWKSALDALLRDLRAGGNVRWIAGALHNCLASAIVAVADRIGEPRVVLTGGCFQNRLLTEAAVSALRTAGFEPVLHRAIPPNDGGISLGQAAWVAWAEQRKQQSCA